MATLRQASVAGGASALAVSATPTIPPVDVVALTDGEGTLLGFENGGLKVTEAAVTAQHSTAAVNTQVQQTFGAVAGQSHRLMSLSVSYSAAPTGGKITVADGGTTILELDITAAGPLVVPLPPGGLKGTVNTAMTVTLAAAGAAVVGKVNTGRVTA